jgi:Raf kinase inhibitor-like YbhB/YbcL family protein
MSTTFTLFSNDIGGQGTVNEAFDGFGCTGKNRSPHLEWKNAPASTKSFALTLYDPDAPTGSGWWHWLVFDIPAALVQLPQGAGNVNAGILPSQVVQSINDYGITGYGGPCPPQGHGFHQYIFTLFALDVESLQLSKETNPAVVGFNINAHTIEKASLVMYYKRD